MAADPPVTPDSDRKKRTPPQYWVSSIYFAEGFPYSLVNNVVEILFQQMGASLKTIGLTSLYHLPWNLKFLWGPFVDQYETKRRWLVGVEVALSVALVLLAIFVGAASQISTLVVVAVLLIAILSATHDIAIDGYYLEALDEKEQSTFVGFRATFYRIAGLSLSGPFLWLIGKTSWFIGLLVIAALMTLLTVYHIFLLPRAESRRSPIGELLSLLIRPRLLWVAGGVALLIALARRHSWAETARKALAELPVVGDLSLSEWLVIGLVGALLTAVAWNRRTKTQAPGPRSAYVESFTSFMDQDKPLLVLGFVILFRTGESFLVKMRWPFLNAQLEMSLESYAFVNGTIGVIASFVATLLGGWAIGKWGFRRLIWPFVAAQNFLNLLYMWLAHGTDAAISPWAVGTVIAVEHAGSGLGTAVFMVYLMRCCDPLHKAGHMAILTALMSVSFTIAGVFSGFLAEAAGFSLYFGLTFLATIPSMLMIPWLPYLDHGRGRGLP